MVGTELTRNALKDLLEQPDLIDASSPEAANVVRHSKTGRQVQVLDSSRGGGNAVMVVWWGYPGKPPYTTMDYMDHRALVADVGRYLTLGIIPARSDVLS
jgi:hypothetical protein